MKHVSIITLVLCLSNCICAGTPKESAKPIKVFLLAGQSNMQGQGVVAMDHPDYYNGGKGNLLWSMKNSKSAGIMKHLKDDQGDWVVRDDVKVWFKVASGITKGGLTVGFTGYVSPENAKVGKGGDSHIGPELQFGHVIGNYLDEPVLLVKTAWGGKSLYVDFRPPSSGGTVGPYYTQMLAEIRQALADIENLFPGRKNHEYDIAGFVWMQGWNDMCTPQAIPEYDKNLVNLVKDLRKEFKLPNLLCVIGELGNGGPAQPGSNMQAFRDAQRRGTEQIDNAVFVETTDFARPAEESPNTGHGHHWYGNAESYFLIGNALGQAMVQLLANQNIAQIPPKSTIPTQIICGTSPIPQPYPYISTGSFCGPDIPLSPDPLISYRWPNPKATDGLEIYLLKPKSVSADRTQSFDNLQSLTGDNPNLTVTGTGSIRLDFGLENAAWIEFDSPDCPGGVEMSISEYNEPGPGKTSKPVKHGNTYRLELNNELYEGVRFAWIEVNSLSSQWHITGIRAVCQIKPTNYNGGFSCSDPMLTKTWYMCAYGVKASLCKDYFGAILMNRGDRMSWTGDAHPTQAAALVAFGNYDFIKQNIDNTSEQSNGIRSYSLYWVLSLLDYYNYTGDTQTLDKYITNACAKLDDAFNVFGTDPNLRYYGWDERLCAGFELWFKPCPEAQNAYEMLSIRVWKDFATVMGKYGRTDLRDKYNGYASAKMADLRKNSDWFADFGLHAAADAVTTGLLNSAEQNTLFEKHFTDRVNRISFSPFNQYFIIQAMARMKKYDDALSSVRDLWGGMIKYGATTTFEDFRPSWNYIIGPSDALPNNQCGIISLCHPWGAGPVKWLNEEVLGIVPTSPGFKTYDVLPHLGRTLTEVSGKTPTPLGDICASFDLASGICKVSAPAGAIGRIGIPKVEKTIKSISINGNLAWDGSWHSVSGVGAAGQDSDFVYFTSVQPGDYTMSVSYSGTTPAYNEPQEKYAARFVKHDTTTSGNWGGVYGKDGYVLCNFNGKGRDEKSLPSYVTSLDYFRAFPTTKDCLPDSTTWVTETSDKRALSPDSKNSTPRNAACYSNNDNTMTVSIGIDGTRDYQIALYFVDWDKKNMRQAVEIFDENTLTMIAPVKMVDDYSGGRYLVYSYNKSVKFRIDKIRGDIATLSGIFFDPKEPL